MFVSYLVMQQQMGATAATVLFRHLTSCLFYLLKHAWLFFTVVFNKVIIPDYLVLTMAADIFKAAAKAYHKLVHTKKRSIYDAKYMAHLLRWILLLLLQN